MYQVYNNLIFTTLHWMQGGLVTRKLFVRPSVKGVHCDKMEGRFVQIFIPYERSFSLVLWEEKWLVGATPSTWNFWSTGPRWSKIADFEQIFAQILLRTDLASVLSQSTRLTDGRTDGQTDRQPDTFLIASPCWHFMQRGRPASVNTLCAVWTLAIDAHAYNGSAFRNVFCAV